MKIQICESIRDGELIAALSNGEKCVYVARIEGENSCESFCWYYPHEVIITEPVREIAKANLPCDFTRFLAASKFGYLWRGMFPVPLTTAQNMFHERWNVYVLCKDGSEYEACDEDELQKADFLGVTVEDWLIRCGVINSDHTVNTNVENTTQIVPGNVELPSEDYEELLTYRRTGLSPQEIQEAVDLFSDTNATIPEEIKGWVKRASFHAYKCVELEQQISKLQNELEQFKQEKVLKLRAEVVTRLMDELDKRVDDLFMGVEMCSEIVKRIIVQIACELALDMTIISVVANSKFTLEQYTKLKAFDAGASLLGAIQKTLHEKRPCGQFSDSDADIIRAIELLIEEQGRGG